MLFNRDASVELIGRDKMIENFVFTFEKKLETLKKILAAEQQESHAKDQKIQRLTEKVRELQEVCFFF